MKETAHLPEPLTEETPHYSELSQMEETPHCPEPLTEETPHYPEPSVMEETPPHPEPLIEKTLHCPEPAVMEETAHYTELAVTKESPHYPEPLTEEIPHCPEPTVTEETPHHPEPLMEKTLHYPEPAVIEETPHHPEPLMEKTLLHSEPLIVGTPRQPPLSLMEEGEHYLAPSLRVDSPHSPELLQIEDGSHSPGLSSVEEVHSCFDNLQPFIAALSIAFFAKALSGSYMKSANTQMERRFDIPNSLIGIIDGSFEIGNLLVIAFVSYFGAKFHRPKLIGAGMILMAVGTFLIAFPHFIMGSYEYESALRPLHNSTSSMSLCSIDPYIKLKSKFIDASSLLPKLGCENKAESSLWIYVLFGNLLRGIGETPVIPLGVSYLDDHAKQENFAFYLGCMYTVGLLGPIFGFVLGSFCAKLFVDVRFVSSDSLTITPKDSRWVGAWWLGFLLVGVISVLAAIPICFFPKTMPREGEGKKRQRGSMNQDKEDNHGDAGQTTFGSTKFAAMTKDFLPSVKSLICNPIYFLILLLSVLQVNSVIGKLTYKPKFIEQQYGHTASRANLLVGIVNVPPVAIGIFCGGLVMKRFKLSVTGAAKLWIGSALAAWMFHILFFAMGCRKTPVAGLTISYEGIAQSSHEEQIFSGCNTGCMCSRTEWEPVCGKNGITYVTPCLAGCKSSNGTGVKMEFHNCSCISHLISINSSAILGQCPKTDDCNKVFPYFLLVTVIESFTYSFGAMAELEILIRSIEPKLKPLAIGIYSLTVRMFAGIPAPIYYGALIDTACLKWGSNRCGGRGACRIYDSETFRSVYIGMAAVTEAICCILFIPFYVQLKKHFPPEDEKFLDNECTELAIINEDDNGIDVNLLRRVVELNH